MKIRHAMTAATPKESREFHNAIQRLTNGINKNDVLLISKNEDGRFIFGLSRASIGQSLADNLRSISIEQ